MSRGYSRVILVGNIGRDPEMRYSQNGTPITNFSLAVNRRRRQPDGNFTDETDWYRVTLFRNMAETANEWLHKGSKVLVEGQLQIRTYTGNDGIERTSVDVNADNFVNLTPRDEFSGAGGPTPIVQRPERGAAPGAPQRGPRPVPGGGPNPPMGDDEDDFDDVPF